MSIQFSSAKFFHLQELRSPIVLLKWLFISFVVGALYLGSAKLGLLLALPIPPGNITAVWPPSAVAWIAVLWLGYRVFPVIWLANLAANLPGILGSSQNWMKALMSTSLIGGAAALEATLGIFLLQYWIRKTYFFDRALGVFKFVLVALFSPALNALISVSIICLSGSASWANFGSLWSAWWIGNAIAVLIFLPAFMIWRQGIQDQRLKGWRWLEVAVLLAVLLIIAHIAFTLGYPIEYLLIPCLVWATFRHGQLGGISGVVIVTTAALVGTVQGHGSFVRPVLSESLILLQTFMGSVALTSLVLGAALAERSQSELAREKANQDLAASVLELQASEAALRDRTQQLETTLQDLQQAQTQLVQSEKMSALGNLVAGIAHEINNPLSFLKGNIKPALDYVAELFGLLDLYQHHYPQPEAAIQSEIDTIDLEFIREDLPTLVHSMEDGVDRIRSISTSLRTFSRADSDRPVPFSLHAGLNSTILILKHRLKANESRPTIEVITDYGEIPLVECFAGQINQVFMNLLANAIDALEEFNQTRTFDQIKSNPNRITVQTRLTKDQNYVKIHIQDNGAGIPEEIKPKIFDHLFTTKEVGKGTGLGLAIARSIVVDKHAGTLEVNSSPNQGAEFVITLPVEATVTAIPFEK
ncbi:MAG: MASE1 domain-containing protein [Leptolyngbyaceae cyanobacterium bins.302]|nr:MASE1 domain-containing protein [Leptolyngbyaceae cyanobacterium bins.302]